MHCAALDDAVDSRFNALPPKRPLRRKRGVYRERKAFIYPIGQHNMLWARFCKGWTGRGLLF